jgi:hypothetical protein
MTHAGVDTGRHTGAHVRVLLRLVQVLWMVVRLLLGWEVMRWLLHALHVHLLQVWHLHMRRQIGHRTRRQIGHRTRWQIGETTGTRWTAELPGHVHRVCGNRTGVHHTGEAGRRHAANCSGRSSSSSSSSSTRGATASPCSNAIVGRLTRTGGEQSVWLQLG